MEQDIKSLKNVPLEIFYDPCKNGTDLIKEVYIPCLSNSIRYDRVAAYFNSSVLRYYSAGLVNLYENGGHARFIFSCETDAFELDKISKAYNEKMDSMSEELDDNELIDDFNVANLSFLIKHNLADVKIAFMLEGKASLMHIKQAVFEDSDGNKVHLSGSGNETPNGLKENAEIVYVFTNFGKGSEYSDKGDQIFSGLWNNTYSDSVFCVEPNGPLYEKLISFNKERTFNSQLEFDSYRFDGLVYIDVDLDESEIKVYDFTQDKSLSLPGGISSSCKGRITSPEPNVYIIKGITLSDIRDVIPARVKRFNENFVYSKKAQAYIDEQNLNLDKRVSLATAIKKNEYLEKWGENYEEFKEIINSKTMIPLKEEQLHNAYHHYIMKSSMDFSVPGTGKTYISYGLFSFLDRNKNIEQSVDHLIVFGPLACFKAWKDECATLFGDKYTIFDLSKNKANASRELHNNKYHIYLINYESLNNEKLARDISNYITDEKALVIFDEIHRIKNIAGIRANSVIAIMEGAKHKPVYKLALTGTPLPNSFLDLYNYIKILYQDDLNGFLHDFSDNELRLADSNETVAKEIRDNLFPLFTRTTKADLNIPLPNADNLDNLSVVPTDDEESLYEYVYKSYENKKGFVRFIRLIQASSNPRLLLKTINREEIKELEGDDTESNELKEEDFKTSSLYSKEIEELVNNIGLSTKTKASIDLIVNMIGEGKRVIVWCLFIDTIDLIVKELTKRGIRVISISGKDTNLDIRNSKIDKFKSGEIEVLVTNPNTLAESVSLHMNCHDAIYLEYGYNLTYMLQSKDRIHRVGLPEGTETNYYYAISDSTNPLGQIDLKIYDRLKMKEERMKKAIESNDIIFVKDSGIESDIDFILNSLDNQK